MKVFIITSCLLAVALASYPAHHHYPQHIPVIGHNGVPLEPAEVVHARQAHLAIVAATKAHRGHGGYDGVYGGGYGGAYGAGYGGAYTGAGHSYGGYGHGAYHIPVIGHNGVPLDTPEVAHAKAAHFAAHAKAAAAAGPGHYGGHYDGHYRKRRSAYGYAAQHIPVIGHHGVPLDTPEVAAAKSAHFAAHAKASHGYGGYGGYGAPIAALGHGQHYNIHSYPKLAHDGQPLETPEVVALKHAHFAAHAEANSRLGGYGGGYAHAGYDDGSYHGEGGHGGASYHGEGGHGGYHGGYHIPVIGHNGVPLDTPEVAAARQHHLAALSEASARSHDHSGYGHGHGYY